MQSPSSTQQLLQKKDRSPAKPKEAQIIAQEESSRCLAKLLFCRIICALNPDLNKRNHHAFGESNSPQAIIRNCETASDFGSKPPLNETSKMNNDSKKTKKRRDEHILKLHKKKNNANENNSKFFASMNSNLHPMIQLADESIQKIDRQLDCSSLHFNSMSLKTSMNSKKKRGLKIGNKITYILGPGAQILTPNSNLAVNSKFCKEPKMTIEEIESDRNSDATTVKDTSKNGLEERQVSINSGSKKRKKSKKKSDKCMYLNSPPLSNLDRRSKKNLNKIMAELENPNSKLRKPNHNVQNSLGSFQEEAPMSLKEEGLEVIKSSKLSAFHTEDGSNQRSEHFMEVKSRYENEIKMLREKLAEAHNREKEMHRKIDRLEKDFKEFGVEDLKKNIQKGKYQNIDEYVNHLIISKYQKAKDQLENSSSATGDKSVDFSNDKMGILKCIQALINEIFKFREVIEFQNTEIDYLRQKENKLMYLFYMLHRRGIDVNSIYDSELKDVPTERFNEWIKEHMTEDEPPPEFSFESQASYSPICKGPMLKPNKPKCVPLLNFETIPDYVTSSDEAEGNDSLEGSKLHRKSEIESDSSILQYDKDQAYSQYKEDSLLLKESTNQSKSKNNYYPLASDYEEN